MRTMKKLIPAVLAAILLLTACGGEEAVSLNMDNLANRLMQEITYEDTISETTPEMAQMLYGYADGQVVNCKVIISAGATTEEIAIFECADDQAVADVEAGAKARIEAQKVSVQSYKPEEMTRLDAAIVQVSAPYVIVSISSDSGTAQTIIDEALGK